MNIWYAYTDGSCLQNPSGKGGWAAIVFDPKGIPMKISGYAPSTTNQRMELTAALMALRSVPHGVKVVLYSDSQYLCKAFNDGWIKNWIKNGWVNSKKEPVANKDLWDSILNELEDRTIVPKWVKGHASNILNNECDSMARSISAFAESIGEKFREYE